MIDRLGTIGILYEQFDQSIIYKKLDGQPASDSTCNC